MRVDEASVPERRDELCLQQSAADSTALCCRHKDSLIPGHNCSVVMLQLIVVFLVFAMAAAFAEAPARQGIALQPHTPDWVARQIDTRDTGRDSRAEMRMRLYDRHGRVRERTMVLLTLKGTAGKGDKTLVRFTYPNDIKNTAFLVWEHPDADDERFLYLPALGRVRRIAGEEKQESFVGSDLTYEDIGGRDIADYSYAFTDANATWTAPDGSKHPAWSLESRAKDRDADYPRTVSLVRKDNFVIVHADIFSARNERVKVFDVKKIERVDGVWTTLSMVVANERDRTRTELETTSIRYNVGLTDNDFTRRQLEQPTGARSSR